MEQSEKTLDMIVNLCKNRGYVFPGSEIYGGLANSWDYGPLGVEFKNNVKKAWLKKFVQESPYNVGLDAAIIMNPQTWVTTGHVSSFSDPLMDCRACKARHRADKLIGEEHPEVNVDAMSFDEMDAFIAEHEDIVCPVCGKHDFTPIRKFNLMFKTAIGVTEDSSSTCYLRPETAQGIFVNFANIQRTTRRKLPFGVCQVGKAFRNEITPGNFTFRTREFEQMECEFFCKPGTDLEWFAYWKDYCENWLLSLGIKKEHLRLRDHEPAELAFYSRATTDIEYAFPFTDWGELWGIADRTNYDLTRHQEASGKSLEYFDSETNEHYIPYVIEPSLGCDRVALAFLCEAYDEEHLTDSKGKEDIRTVLHLHPALAPYKCAVLPLSKKLGEKAMEIRNELSKLTPDTVEELSSKLPENSRSLVITYMRQVLDARDTPAQVQRLLANFEIAADKDLAISKTLTKLGPILGLMGTLIPMGPALAGLASGDIASMAYNMQIAFATTVVGLVAGAVGFLTQQVKQRWYLQDMTNLEFISELLNDKRSIHKTSEK